MVSCTQRWVIPDAMTPARSTSPERSHQSRCVLTGDRPVTRVVGAYFEDREPEVSDSITIDARRSVHLRSDDPSRIGGLRIRSGVPYGLVARADGPLWIQYSRLDTTQAAYTLLTARPAAEPA
jgi:hypothetical protein